MHLQANGESTQRQKAIQLFDRGPSSQHGNRSRLWQVFVHVLAKDSKSALLLHVQADAVSRCFPLASLAMLATVQKWSKALNSNPDGHHLASTLQGLAARLVSAVYSTTCSLVR